MALETVTKMYGVDDIKIFEVTADTATTYTVGPAVDVPGARQISLKAEIESKDLTGDEITLDVIAKCKALTITFEFAKLSLEMQKIIMGGTTSTSGTGDTEEVTYDFEEGDAPKYFQFQAQIKSTDNEGGDLHIIAFKCKATSAPINGVQGDYATFTVDAKASFTENHISGTKKKLYRLRLHKKATDLAGVASS